MLQNPDIAQSQQVEISIMPEKCRRVIQFLDIFQSRHPVTTKVFDYLEDLHMHIVANAQLRYEACAQYFEGLDLTLAIKSHTQQSGTGLQQCRGQTRQVHVRWTNCHSFPERSQGLWSLSHCIYGWECGQLQIHSRLQCCSYRWIGCLINLGPAALRASACGVVDLDVFWDGLQERLPILSVLAKRYKDVIVNSADAERSNSICKLVLSSRRRSVSNNNLKALVFLYHNQRLTSGAFEMVEVQFWGGYWGLVSSQKTRWQMHFTQHNAILFNCALFLGIFQHTWCLMFTV